MIDNLTASVQATHRYAWIGTLLIDARTILCTFRTDDAFGTTIWRTANVAGQTWADSVLVYDATLAVQATRRRVARINRSDISCTTTAATREKLIIIRQIMGWKKGNWFWLWAYWAVRLLDSSHSMDFRWSRSDNCTEASDLWRDIRRSGRKRLDMDLCIYCSDRHDDLGNRCLWHIPGDSRCTDLRCNRVGMRTHRHHFSRCKLHSSRMATDGMAEGSHLGVV